MVIILWRNYSTLNSIIPCYLNNSSQTAVFETLVPSKLNYSVICFHVARMFQVLMSSNFISRGN